MKTLKVSTKNNQHKVDTLDTPTADIIGFVPDNF